MVRLVRRRLFHRTTPANGAELRSPRLRYGTCNRAHGPPPKAGGYNNPRRRCRQAGRDTIPSRLCGVSDYGHNFLQGKPIPPVPVVMFSECPNLL